MRMRRMELRMKLRMKLRMQLVSVHDVVKSWECVHFIYLML